MKEKNYLIVNWILCSVICFVMAFLGSMLLLEVEQIELIRGNSYYLSSIDIFIKTILWPARYCVKYTAIAEIFCQLVFWIGLLFIPKEKRKQKNFGYIIIASIISCVTSAVFIVILIYLFALFNYRNIIM